MSKLIIEMPRNILKSYDKGGLIQGLLDLDGRNSQKYIHQT